MMRRDNIEGKKLSRVGKLKGNKEKDCDGSLGFQDGGKSRETGTQKEKEQQHTPPPPAPPGPFPSARTDVQIRSLPSHKGILTKMIFLFAFEEGTLCLNSV